MNTAVAVLRWEEPPDDRRGRPGRARRRDFAAVAAELRARPGEWGVVAECPHSGGAGLTTRICTGALRAFQPARSFEAVSRVVDGRAVVYARFLGGLS